MSTYRIISEKELLQRQTEWRDLVSQSSPQTIFEQPAYLVPWIEIFTQPNQRLLQGIVNEADQVVAVLPFFWETKTTLRLLGAVDLSDYLEIVTAPQERTQLYPFILSHFKGLLTSTQTLKLESLPSTSTNLTEFLKLAEKDGWKSQQTQQDICPVLALPANWEEYFSSLESKSQQTFKRLQKTIGVEDEISYSCFTTKSDIENYLPTFIQLHKASSTEKRQFWTPEREAFFLRSSTNLATAGWIKLFFLMVDGTPAASLLIFEYQDQYLLYNSGYDAYRFGHLGVGNAILLHTIKDAIKNGHHRYDFMRGDEAYKFLFGSKAEPLFDLELIPPAQ